MNFQRKIFFITGCQRSGTTLLRLILASHSQIVCIDENTAHLMLSSSSGWQQIRQILAKDIWCGFKIPRFAEQLDAPALSDYGLIGESPNFYRNDPVFFMTRDVRDVICSMRGLQHKGETWLSHWGIPILNYWIKRSKAFAGEFAEDIERARQSECPDVAMGALYWKYKNVAYFRYQDLGYPVVQVRYEDLVTDATDQIKGIVSFLGLPWEDSLLGHHKLDHFETNEQGMAVGGTDTRQPITSASMGRFHTDLGKEELEIIDLIAGDIAGRLGYQLR